MTRGLLARWRRLPPGRRRLLAEAAAELVRARLMLRLRPFQRIVEGAARPLAAAADPLSGEQIASEVETAARHLPWTPVCFDLGLAVQRMLRRRGRDAILHYGIGHDGPNLVAHVWVSLDGTTLIGGEQAPTVREVACYPRAR